MLSSPATPVSRADSVTCVPMVVFSSRVVSVRSYAAGAVGGQIAGRRRRLDRPTVELAT